MMKLDYHCLNKFVHRVSYHHSYTYTASQTLEHIYNARLISKTKLTQLQQLSDSSIIQVMEEIEIKNSMILLQNAPLICY